jgi:hypothetical protein
MKVFNHVFNTWMLAQLFHPIIFFGYFLLVLHSPIEPGALVSLMVGSFIISAPSLFISFLLLRLIIGKRVSTSLLLFLWILICGTSIFLNIALFILLFGGILSDIPFEFTIPAFAAALLSILIRMPLFFQLAAHTKYERNENELHYENQNPNLF